MVFRCVVTRAPVDCVHPTSPSPPPRSCIPTYNTTSTVSTVCDNPKGISSSDPACLVAATTTVGTVVAPAKTNLLYDQLNTARNTWGRYLGDLARCWWVILVCAIGIAVGTGFVFVTFLKYFTGCMVWSIILLTIGILSFLTAYFYYKAGLISVPSYVSSAVSTVASSVAASTTSVSSLTTFSLSGTGAGSSYAIIAYVATAVTLIVLCITIAVASSLVTAIEVIKLGTDALQATPSLVFFPCTNIAALGLFGMWWVFIAAELASGGSAVTVAPRSATRPFVAPPPFSA
jgi:hypothetical protein